VIDLSGAEYKYDKDFASPDEILKYVSDYDIYRAYIPKVEVGSVISSPLRRDTHPSFSIFYSKRANRLLFHDFKEGITGDVFSFLKLKFPGLTFSQILQDIVWTFALDDKFVCNYKIAGHKKFDKALTTASSFKELEIKRIRVKTRNWEDYDELFWSSYGISRHTLNFFNVSPVEYIFIENLTKSTESILKADRYSYGYYENKDYISFKIYQPYSKDLKFLGSHDSTVHSGYNQLPGVGDILIITKSLKDVMAIHENSQLPTVSIQSESILMKDKVMHEYKSRFKQVITLFDNDSTGIKLSKLYFDNFGTKSIMIPTHSKYPITDYSDVIKHINKKTAIFILNKLMNNETI